MSLVKDGFVVVTKIDQMDFGTGEASGKIKLRVGKLAAHDSFLMQP